MSMQLIIRGLSMRKKIIAIIVILALVLSLAGCSKKENTNDTSGEAETEAEGESSTSTDIELPVEDDSNYVEDEAVVKEFAEFVDAQYKESIESSYITMHMFYLDPEAAGLNMDNVAIEFGEASTPEKNAEDRAYYQDLKAKLESFDRSKLTREQRDEYDALDWEINIVLQLLDEKFDYYEQLFAPPNSLDQNIITYLTTFELRSEREVQEIITLINSLPKYVDSAIEYAKIQQEKELFMTDFDTVIAACDDVLNLGMNSSVLTKLHEKIDEREEISQENRESYKAQISEAFEKSYLPVFQSIKDAMNEMKDGYNNTEGYSAFPNGADYFEVMMNYSLGLKDVSVKEMKSFLEERQELHMDDFYDYLTSHPEALAIATGLEDGIAESTGYTDYLEILEEVKSVMYKDHPEVKNLEYNVEPADPEEKLDEKHVAAYFLVPPLDGDHKQQMRINPSNDDVGTIDSYITITHEGFPGHMYQYAYMYDNLHSDYMKTLSVDGNVEGYAVYAEFGALDYLNSVQEASKKISILDTQLGYITYILVDIGINYEGWSKDDALDFFTDAGYALDESSISEIYDYLRCTPTSYAPYGYGYELIAVLREKAEEELGDKFNAKEFNTALLNAGPSPYSIVQHHISEYINNAK